MRLLAAAAAALALAAAQPAAAGGQLNLYCSGPVEWCQEMATGFQAAAGVTVAMTDRKSVV